MHFLHRINFVPHELCDAVVVCPACADWGLEQRVAVTVDTRLARPAPATRRVSRRRSSIGTFPAHTEQGCPDGEIKRGRAMLRARDPTTLLSCGPEGGGIRQSEDGLRFSGTCV